MKPNFRRKELVHSLQSLTPESGVLYRRAESVFAGGAVGGGVHQNPWPIYMESGEGAYIRDVDGNRYIDCCLGAGTLIAGHNHPDMQAAIQQQSAKAMMHSGFSPLPIQVAERLAAVFPCSEKVFFCNSGTEAVQKSIMLARASTKKNKIAKFEGSYHGTYDQSCISVIQFSENEHKPEPVPMISGTPDRALEDTVILPFNNPLAIDFIEANSDSLAAVIIEPIATIGLFFMSRDFVCAIREITAKHGILLIFDEVLTGFRVGRGGCQAYFNVTPDIAAYGKALGGGVPIGAVACNNSVLNGLLNASPPLRLGGTFSGNPLSMAAAHAALAIMLDESGCFFDVLGKKCSRFSDTLNQRLSMEKIPAYVSHVGSMFFVHMNNMGAQYPRDLAKEDMKKQDELCLRLKLNGVYTENSHTAFISSAHSEADIDHLTDVYFQCISDCFVE